MYISKNELGAVKMLEPSSSEEEDEDYLQEQNGYGQVINN